MKWKFGHMGSLNLWNFEMLRPRNQETSRPRNQEINNKTKSRNEETKKSRKPTFPRRLRARLKADLELVPDSPSRPQNYYMIPRMFIVFKILPMST